MRAVYAVSSTYCFVMLVAATSTVQEDKSFLSSVVELVEFDYVDSCANRANAAWDELTGSENGFSKKLELDKAFGPVTQGISNELKNAYNKKLIGDDDELLRRKVKLLLEPGDVLLDTDQWIKLVTFADKAQNKLRFATNYDCGTATNCSLRELHNNFAIEQDDMNRIRMKESWERNLPDINEYLEQILPLLINASKANGGFKTVEEYWDFLVEYEGAILKARELWDSVKPLYMKLHKYIALKLKGKEAVGKPLPAYLFRSLNGDDWSNVVESLLPKHAGIYKAVHANLKLKDLGGRKAFDVASKLISELKLGEIKQEVFDKSIFNSTCPSVIVDECKSNKVRVITCKEVSVPNYLEAHETAMKIMYKQITGSYSNNTYVLREAPRYSAIYEAIPGFISLLALSPHAIDRNNLFPIQTFHLNPNHHRIVLQLMIALKDLPKLNYYLAADEWRLLRLKVLMGKSSQTEGAISWGDFRKNFSLIETSDVDILADPYVVYNKPFIGKFMGLILKYQIYQTFAEELINDESDLILHVASTNDRLRETMVQAFSVKWPELVSHLLAKREDGLEYTALTDYYRLLDEYLEVQIDPPPPDFIDIDDYMDPEEPLPTETIDYDSNDLSSIVNPEPEIPEDPLNNVIDTGEETNSKYGSEASNVLEVKNMEVKKKEAENKEDESVTQEASYNVYWWVGIGVALAVVVILIAIIARKRHNHRKQLEKQRRENSRA